jgi:hypothetical protein
MALKMMPLKITLNTMRVQRDNHNLLNPYAVVVVMTAHNQPAILLLLSQ